MHFFSCFYSCLWILISASLARTEKICSCADCLINDACEFAKEADLNSRLILRYLHKNGLLSEQPEIDMEKVNKCDEYRLNSLAAYLFDLQTPADVEDICSDTCSHYKCYRNLQSIDSWQVVKDGGCNENGLKKQLRTIGAFLNAFKHGLLVAIKQQDQHIVYPEWLKSSCPQQQTPTIKHVVEVLFDAITTAFHCPAFSGRSNNLYVPCDPQDMHDEDGTVEMNGKRNNFDSNQNLPSHSGNQNWDSKPAPLPIELLSERLQLVQGLTMVLSNYKAHGEQTCLNETEVAIKQICGPFYDEMFVSKIRIIQDVQRYVLGCKNCQDTERKCTGPTHEPLIRTVAEFESRKQLLDSVVRAYLKCSGLERECMEERKRDTPVEVFQLVDELTKVLIGCDACQQDPCSDPSSCPPPLKLSPTSKYLAIPQIAKYTQSCMSRNQDVDTLDPIKQPGTSDGVYTDNYQSLDKYPDNYDNDPSDYVDTSAQGPPTPSPDEHFMKMFINSRHLVEFKSIYKFITLILSLKEVKSSPMDDDFYGGVAIREETECKTMEALSLPECQQFAVKRKVKAFLHKISAIAGCHRDNVYEGLNMCQNNVAEFTEACVFDSETGDFSNKQAEVVKQAAILSGLFFSGCLSTVNQDAYDKAVMECSYYATILRTEQDDMFGDKQGMLLYKQHLKSHPLLFTYDDEGRDMIKGLYQLKKCSDRCPFNFAYCAVNKVCLPSWMSCGGKSAQLDVQLLQNMRMNMSVSEAWPASKLSKSGFLLINRGDDERSIGDWQFNYDGGWHNLSSVPLQNAIKLDATTQIRYSLDSPQYGYRILYYVIDSMKVSTGKVVQPQGRTMSAVMLIHPLPMASRFTLHSYNKSYSMLEDDYNSNGIPLKELVHLHSPITVVENSMLYALRDMIPSETMKEFDQGLTAFKMSRPIGRLLTDTSPFGLLQLQFNSFNSRVQYIDLKVGQNFSLDYADAKIVFRPAQDYHGSFSINMLVCNCLANNGPTSEQTFSINVTVKSVNDAPKFSNRAPILPEIEFNLTNTPNNGFLVKDLLVRTDACDVESDVDIGIIIHKLPRNKYGKWQYFVESNWSDIVIRDELDHFAMGRWIESVETPVEVLYLDNDQRIRFLLNGDQLWKVGTAYKYTYLGFRLWDKADGIQPGLQNVTLGTIISNSYSLPILGIQLRRGCDEKPGSLARYDRCDICGGNGKGCVGCDGAMIDRCGVCTGGVTNITFNQYQDCAGTCALSELDDCDICQKKKFMRNFKDCEGICFGDAVLDECGVCTGGSTGVYSVMDLCGVCNGEGDSCFGCDNVAGSGKVLDLCGKCLHPSDATFDFGCFQLGDVHPAIASSSGGEEVEVRGAGFKSDLQCGFVDEKGERQALTIKDIQTKSLIVTTPKLTAGSYTLKCTSENIEKELTKSQFKIYCSESLKVLSVNQSRVAINEPFTLLVTGEGFSDTGEVGCIVLMYGSVQTLPARFIDNTKVECSSQALRKSGTGMLTVSLSRRKWKVSSFNEDLSAVHVAVYAPAPKVLSAKFSNNYRKIAIAFSFPAINKKKACADMFSVSTVGSFGEGFRCGFVTQTKLQVYLGRKATVKTGDVLSIGAESFAPIFQRVFDYTPASNITVSAPYKLLSIEAVMSGQRLLSACDRFTLTARKSTGAAGRKLTFDWNVEFTSNVQNETLTVNETNTLANIKTKLLSSSARNTLRFKPDEFSFSSVDRMIEYNFTLSVVNFLSQRSALKYHVVTRVNDVLPTVRIRGGAMQKLRASKINKLQGFARVPKCARSVANELVFQWDVDSVGVQLDPKSSDKAVLYIYPGTLAGGNTYTISLVVSFKSNPAIVKTVDVEVDMIGSALKPRIKGGYRRVVNSYQGFTLDGSLSKDPDKDQTEEWFEWSCEDMNKVSCFVFDNDFNHYVRYRLPSTATVFVEKGTLESNQTYLFTLRYHKGFRTAETSTYITIKAGSAPIVAIFDQKNLKENRAKRVVIRSGIYSSAGNVRVWLECVNSEEYAFVNLTEPGVLLTPSERLRKAAGKFRLGFVFSKGALSPGATYKFVVYAETVEGVGYAESIIVTNSAPSEGALVCEPNEGDAVSTEFILSAAEGWEDSEEDLPLVYNFGYFDKKGGKRYLGSPSYESEKMSRLPSGDPNNNHQLTVFVQVTDVHGASSQTTAIVTVSPPVKIDVSLITDMKSSIDEAVASDDISSALGNIATALSTFHIDDEEMGKLNTSEQAAVSGTLLDFKTNATRSIMVLANNVHDIETQNVVIESMSEMTSGGEQFDDETKSDIAKSLVAIVRQQIGTSKSKRRRRSTEVSETNVAKTAEEVEHILTSFANIITPKNYNNASMEIKKSLTDLSIDLMASMCRNVAFGQPPVIATSDITTLQVSKNSFADVAKTSLKLGCDSNCTKSAHVMLGDELQSRYSEWNCGTDTCAGTCIGSANYNNDLYSNEAKSGIVAEVISLHLFNPDTHNTISIGSLNAPIALHLPFTDASMADYIYSCEMFDVSTMKWSNTHCVSQPMVTVRGYPHASCLCSELGVVTAVATSALVNPVTERTPSSKFANVQVKFNNDYEAVLKQVTKSSLENSITLALVDLLNIERWQITNMTCTNGSIVASFVFLPQDEKLHADALVVFDEKLHQLADHVSSDDIVVYLVDGSQLDLNSTFFGAGIVIRSNTLQTAEEDSSTMLWIIIGSIVGGLALVGTIAFLFKKFKLTSPAYVV